MDGKDQDTIASPRKKKREQSQWGAEIEEMGFSEEEENALLENLLNGTTTDQKNNIETPSQITTSQIIECAPTPNPSPNKLKAAITTANSETTASSSVASFNNLDLEAFIRVIEAYDIEDDLTARIDEFILSRPDILSRLTSMSIIAMNSLRLDLMQRATPPIVAFSTAANEATNLGSKARHKIVSQDEQDLEDLVVLREETMHGLIIPSSPPSPRKKLHT